MVQTQAGLLLLGAKLTVPIGAALLIEIPPDPDAAGATASASSDPAPHSGQQPAQTPFPRLGQALETMRLAGLPSPPGLAGHLPHTGPRLAEGLMAALAATRDDDPAAGLDRLLRPALEHLGQGDVADGVRQELTRAAALAGQTAQADWRVYLLPLLDDGRLHQLRIYERQQRGRPGSGAVPGSRFVVEVELSRLGAVQLDGLVQPRRFDLMVRSREPLSEAMRRDIAAIFAEARAAAGFAGEIGFQQTAVFPVNPKTAEGPGAGLVV
ncbi:MAG: hypothetical protein IRY94_04950 [Rhodospirillaceae bacterium]|nr:hypothetical protein [Rhodospirillaceae bacterium]